MRGSVLVEADASSKHIYVFQCPYSPFDDLSAGILAWKCGPAFAGLTAATIALYTAFTFSVTQVWERSCCQPHMTPSLLVVLLH